MSLAPPIVPNVRVGIHSTRESLKQAHGGLISEMDKGMVDEKANQVFRNGLIYTVNRNRTWAQAIAIARDRIVFEGSNDGVAALIGSGTAVIDLEGKTVLPGFADAHAHPDKEIFRGSGWADTFLQNIGPTKGILDAIIPDRPIVLVSHDGHSMWVNSATLIKAQITKDTPDPEGGRIEDDPETGEPSGTLRETAFRLVEDVIPGYTLEEQKTALLAYQEMAGRAAITMVHDAMLDAQAIAAFNALAQEGQLKMCFRGSIVESESL